MLANGDLFTLAGFENNDEDGKGDKFNFIMSNGAKTKQRDKGCNYYTLMMPAGAEKRIRAVHIHHKKDWIAGFSFFDKDGLTIF